MTDPHINITSQEFVDAQGDAPVALLLCADLMFNVQLQNIARAEGFRIVNLRPGAPIPPEATVLVVNLADLGRTRSWESSVREASEQSITVIGFGPHVDTETRRLAKESGASRVLANSNLTRDLPTILRSLRPSRTQEEL